MTHSAERVFLSSTGFDLEDYRRAAIDACNQLQMIPIAMEHFEAMGKGATEGSKSKLDEADVYVGFFAHRYGYIEEGYDRSVTELEFEYAEHLGLDRLCFIVDPDFDWPPSKIEFEQYGELAAFKQRIDKALIRNMFTEVEDFKNKLIGALSRWQRHQSQPESASDTPQTAAVIPPEYCELLRGECTDVALLGMQPKHGQSVSLTSVYVPLTTSDLRHPEREQASEGEAAEQLLPRDQDKDRLLLEALGEDSLYVSGDAGTGKSTFCRWTALVTCEGYVTAQAVKPLDDYTEHLPDSLRDRLPLLVPLREFWHHLPTTPGCRDLSRGELESALAEWTSARFPDLGWPVVQAHIRQGTGLLIFDGIDEVPRTAGDEPHSLAPREMLLAGLSDARAVWSKAGNRVLLTGRPYGLDDAEVQRLGLTYLRIGDLPQPLQDLLVRRWFAILQRTSASAEAVADELIQDLRGRDDAVGQMAANPLLLTAMCIIFSEGKRLPQDKHHLYERILECVLYSRFPYDQPTIARIANQLGAVALGMHSGEGLGETRSAPRAEATYDEIDRLLLAYRDQLGKAGITERAFSSAVESRDLLLSNTGLLLPKGEKKVGFYHLSFQEFLAAQRLLAVVEAGVGSALFDLFCQQAETREWHNTMSFVFGALLANNTTLEKSIRLVDQLMEYLTSTSLDKTLGLQVVVADCLEMLLRKGYRLDDHEQAFREICLSAIEREVSLRQRQRLGLCLGELGDSRVVADLRDLAAYVEIPPDTYLLGDERKPWTIAKPFLLGRYPVTNSQFALFINEGGYENRQWWSDDGWKWRTDEQVTKPLYWRVAKWNAPNQPVVGVSFHEAEAFAKWAGGFIPVENQWEAAARGPKGFEYPWDDEWEDGICNSQEAQLRVTTAVGLFPRAKSVAFGLDDMSGNVFEWCREADGRGVVLRGGCFGVDAQGVRAAFRLLFYLPSDRNSYIGFRLART